MRVRYELFQFDCPAAEKKSGEARKRGRLGRRGSGGRNFCPLALPAEDGLGIGKRFRNSALAGKQNRKVFFSLIEKNFGGARLKKCRENFSVLVAVAERTPGGNAGSGLKIFSKWVRILSLTTHIKTCFLNFIKGINSK